MTPAWAPLSGATIDSVNYRMANFITSDTVPYGYSGLLSGTSTVQGPLETVTVIDNLDITSGNSLYIYEFFPQKARYLIVDVTSGSTDIKATLWLDMD